jgi:hypothetical protein
MSARTCYANGCTAARRPNDLMCKPHWFAVPAPIRQRILATVKPGSIRQSEEYLAAIDEARDALKIGA